MAPAARWTRNALSLFLTAAILFACSTRGPGGGGDGNPPSAPSDVTAIPQPGAILLTWTDTSSNETAFRLYRDTVSGGATGQALTEIATLPADTTTYRDTDVTPGVQYLYAVSADSDGGSSARIYQQGEPVTPAPPEFRLSVSTSGGGGGTVVSSPAGIDCGSTCIADFSEGSSVTLTATPSTGSTFGGWSGACSGTGVCSVTLTDDASVTASFLRLYRLEVELAGGGLGVVRSNPGGIHCGNDCREDFAAGTSLTLITEPDPSSLFVGWSGGGCEGQGNTCSLTLSAATTVTGTFALESERHLLSVSRRGQGRVTSEPAAIDCPGTCIEVFDEDTPVLLTATAAAGWEFVRWEDACRGHICDLSMTQDYSVTAVFEEARR